MTNPNIASPAFKRDPYPFYARLRAEAPVCCISVPGGHTAWLVTRYDDVVRVLKDDCFVKDRFKSLAPEHTTKLSWIPKAFMPLAHNMLDQDPPDHTRLRALVHKAFTPRLVEAMRVRVERLTNEMVDAAERRGRMDLIGDYALPLPATIIAEMLGIDPRDRHKFHHWSSEFVSTDFSKWRMALAFPSVLAFMRYVRKLIRRRRVKPGDDLASALVCAEEAGNQLSEDELLAMIVLLLIAGHETTVNLIGNGMLALFSHPEQMERLRSDPALIKSAVEELLRYDGPVETSTERFAREDVTVAEATIPAGALVFAVLASANRDERQFKNPDTLDLGRENNNHLAFGFGAHYCLGAPLARLEAQIAINTLLRRCKNLRLAIPPEQVRWKRGMMLRGVTALPVAFTK